MVLDQIYIGAEHAPFTDERLKWLRKRFKRESYTINVDHCAAWDYGDSHSFSDVYVRFKDERCEMMYRMAFLDECD